MINFALLGARGGGAPPPKWVCKGGLGFSWGMMDGELGWL